MNQKLEEFAKRSIIEKEWKNFEDDSGGYWRDRHVSLERFAELIIWECIGDFEDRIKTRYDGDQKSIDVGYGMEIVIDSIKQKFGADQ